MSCDSTTRTFFAFISPPFPVLTVHSTSLSIGLGKAENLLLKNPQIITNGQICLKKNKLPYNYLLLFALGLLADGKVLLQEPQSLDDQVHLIKFKLFQSQKALGNYRMADYVVAGSEQCPTLPVLLDVLAVEPPSVVVAFGGVLQSLIETRPHFPNEKKPDIIHRSQFESL